MFEELLYTPPPLIEVSSYFSYEPVHLQTWLNITLIAQNESSKLLGNRCHEISAFIPISITLA